MARLGAVAPMLWSPQVRKSPVGQWQVKLRAEQLSHVPIGLCPLTRAILPFKSKLSYDPDIRYLAAMQPMATDVVGECHAIDGS